jgi:hypothetical protein
MKISEIKSILKTIEKISFLLPNGEKVAPNFHVTEVGKVNKHFIDCGGTIRKEEVANFQLWNANDYDHRLHPEKLLQIIELSEEKLGLGDLPIEVEYQGITIQKFDLGFNQTDFILIPKQTDCLAPDQCGVPENKQKVKIADITNTNSCAPGSGCC